MWCLKINTVTGLGHSAVIQGACVLVSQMYSEEANPLQWGSSFLAVWALHSGIER